MCDGLDWMDGNTQSYLRMGLDWIGLDGMGWLSYTAVTPRASLQSDANNCALLKTIQTIHSLGWEKLHIPLP